MKKQSRSLLTCALLAVLLGVATPAISANRKKPDLGPNVSVFDPSMSASAMQRRINDIYTTQQHNEFGPERNALLFLPGEYKVDIPVGFYTEVLGLGASPDA